jgi:uncharacterized protein YndB with AHSA1/START domain
MTSASENEESTLDFPSDLEMRISRSVNAPRRLVWIAWTDPKHIPHWLLGPPNWTMPVCEVDLRVGGSYRFVYAMPDGTVGMTLLGEYLAVNPIDQLKCKETWGAPWPWTHNTIDFVDQGARTYVSITMKFESEEARDAAAKTGARDGMEGGFKRLEEYAKTME